MVYTAVSVAYNQAFNDGKPCLIPNAARVPAAVLWEDDTGTDISDAIYPSALSVDGVPVVFSRCVVASATAYVQLRLQLPAPGIGFNSMGIINHNAGDYNADLEVIIANDAAISALPLTIWSATLTTNDRAMRHANAFYSGVEHVVFRFTHPSGFTTGQTVRLGLGFLGNRYQLGRHPDEPVALHSAETRGKTSGTSDLGGWYRYPQGKGLRKLRATWRPTPHDTLVQTGFWSDAAAFDGVYGATEGWSQPFAYCLAPPVASSFVWMTNTSMKQHIEQLSGTFLHRVKYTFEELGPSYDSEINSWT